MSETNVTNKDIIFILRASVALFLSIQVWVWLRFAGALWLSDSLSFIESLLKSVSPLRTSLEGFIVLALPVVAASYVVSRQISSRRFILVSILLGATMSIVYLLFIAFPSFDLFHRQIWVYLVTGIVTGAVYGVILEFPWPTKSEQKIYSTDSLSRRKLLGSIGLLAGTTGLFGSLLGPYYFWKNRNTYVDVELSLLENNQMIVAKVANKPVWILKRPPDVINLLKQENKKLRDPYSENSQQPESANNNLRSIRPEYLVVVGICTHLGCAPTYVPHGDEKFSNSEPLFFCPCHGGAFDLAGRVYNGTPPPVNMVVPAHEYVSENIVRLYFPSLEEEWSG